MNGGSKDIDLWNGTNGNGLGWIIMMFAWQMFTCE